MDSGNIYLRSGSTFRIGSATATNDGDKFKVSGLELSDASLTLNNLTVKGATFNSNDGVVSFTDKTEGTLDIAAGQVIFGDGETEATMQVSNNQVIFTDQDGNLLDVGDPISTNLTMPLEVYDGEDVKFSVSTSGGITILNTTDDAFEMNKSLYLNGMLNIKDKFVVDSDFRLHATEDARFDGELLATNYIATSNLELGDMNEDTFNPRAELKTIEENGKYRLQVEGDANQVLLDQKTLTIETPNNGNKFEFTNEFTITNNNYLMAKIDTDGWISCGKQLTLGDGASDPAVKFIAGENDYSLKVTDLKNQGISIEGNTTIGSSNLDADLTVKGSTTIESDLTVNGDINANAVAMDGNLTVNGETILSGNTTVGSTNVNAELTINGKTTINDGLTVNNNLMLNGTSSIQFDSGEIHRDANTDTIKMDSCRVWMENGARIDEGLEVNGETTIGSSTTNADLTVHGNTNIRANLTVNGETTLNDPVTIENDLTVKDQLTAYRANITDNLVANTSSLTFKSTGEENIVVDYGWLKNILERLTALENNN